MTFDEFKIKLRQCGLNQTSFAKLVGRMPQSVGYWKTNDEVPKWVESYLGLYLDAKRYREECDRLEEELMTVCDSLESIYKKVIGKW